MENCTLPIARYELNFRVTKAFQQHDFAGSMLRGLFGHALREVSCMTGQSDCKQCERYRHCLYSQLFESPPPEEGHKLQKFSQIPAPYVIEPPNWGTKEYLKGSLFSFHIVLTGLALKNLPLILFTWQKALKQNIAKDKGEASLEIVYFCSNDKQKTLVMTSDEEKLLEHDPLLQLPNFDQEYHLNINQVELNFLSPLRLIKKGKLLNVKTLTARDLLMSLAKRINLINEFHNNYQLFEHFSELSQLADDINIHLELDWKDWSRYSNKQHRKIPIGGLVGSITLSGNLFPFVPLIYLGQWFHIGKNTTFGLGQYQLSLPKVINS